MSTNVSESNNNGYLRKPLEFVSKVYVPQAPRIKEDVQNGDYGNAALRTATLAVQAPFSVEMMQDSYTALKDPKNIKLFQGINYSSKGTKLDNWKFLPNTFKESIAKSKYFKNLAPVLDSFDKTLTETKVGGRLLKAIDGNASVVSKAGQTLINGNKAAAFAGNVMSKIPLMGVAMGSMLEIPKVITAAKKGDGFNQLGRSTLNLAGGTIGCAVMATTAGCLIPPFGFFIGATLGGIGGGKIAEKLGHKIFGKPKDNNKFEFAQAIYPYQLKSN